MNLRGIVAVSGRPGLFKLVGQNKTGYILESLDELKTKVISNIANSKLASLEDITIYGEDEDLKLIQIFDNIKASKKELPNTKADIKVLRDFFNEVAPSHDAEKVYASDMKKIISWYLIIKDLPLFTEEPTAKATDEVVKIEDKVEKKVKATVKPVKAKVTAKGNAPAKKASMTSKKGV